MAKITSKAGYTFFFQLLNFITVFNAATTALCEERHDEDQERERMLPQKALTLSGHFLLIIGPTRVESIDISFVFDVLSSIN